jgi:hypothetical protein
MKTLGAALPVLGLSKFLASPIGASSAARFARAAERMNSQPSTANATAAMLALRNAINTARTLNTEQPQN